MNKQTNRQKDITSHCTLAESDDKLKHTASGTVPSKSDGLLVIDVFVDGRGVCPILELYTQQQLSLCHFAVVAARNEPLFEVQTALLGSRGASTHEPSNWLTAS